MGGIHLDVGAGIKNEKNNLDDRELLLVLGIEYRARIQEGYVSYVLIIFARYSYLSTRYTHKDIGKRKDTVGVVLSGCSLRTFMAHK